MRFIQSQPAGTPDDPLPTATLEGLREVIPCDAVDYFELRRADRAVLAHAWIGDVEDVPGTEEAIVALGYQNPLNWRRWRPADGPLRLSEVISRRELERLEFYWAVLEPNRVHDSLKVWLWSSPVSAACVDFTRYKADFSRREQDLLAVLQGHLIEMRTQALAASPSRDDRAQLDLTPREAQILSWVARGHSNEEIAAIMGTATSTVRKHLEHSFEKLGVRSRAEAVWRLTVPDA